MLTKIKSELTAKGKLTVKVKVRPNAGTTRIKGMLADGTLKIDVAAPPEKGRANEELKNFLAGQFSIPGKNIKIISGQTSGLKIIKLDIRKINKLATNQRSNQRPINGKYL